MKPIKVDLNIDNIPYLNFDDACYYFLDYKPNSGFDVNSLVFNFKKDLSFKNHPSWYYRNDAIKEFAKMINNAFLNINKNIFNIIPMPTSKPKNSTEFNNRLIQTMEELLKLDSSYKIFDCFDVQNNLVPAHHNGCRNPNDLKQKIQFDPPNSFNKNIVLIDDVLTTGGHFKACKNILLEKLDPNINVIGLFLAKTEHYYY
ncbi:hypothetical protein IO402_001489 [Campylobacter lari]|nr:hypothetical protein [Campylobacter lari]EAJ0335863.1 hypothetical protein [Campylobacter lari]EAL5740259.1 hypothetical protein [Campylobacter lari]EGK8088291.1 hypothetical protein [Campylobacter lari]EMC9372752.1 hypothetical protein [Campylobacter lari]